MSLLELTQDPAFRDRIAQRLAGAVQIPTIVTDGMGHVGEDSRWEIFYSFAVYLQQTFRSVYVNCLIAALASELLLSREMIQSRRSQRNHGERAWSVVHLARLGRQPQASAADGTL